MASGQTHTLVTVAAAGLVGMLALPLAAKDVRILAVVPGCLAGMFLSPDLDVSQNISGWHVRRFGGIAGELLSFLWRLFWWPYAAIIPHRHWVSHAPVVSTLIRLVYLATPLLALLILLGSLEWALLFVLDHQLMFVSALFGLGLSDLLHWILDWGPL